MLGLLIGLVVAICALLLLCHIYYNNHHFKVEYYNVKSPNLPDAFEQSKIVFITDLHDHSFGSSNCRLLEAVEREKPDFVMVGGDMLIKGEDFRIETALALLKKLAENYPVYYAPGNHEQRLGEWENTRERFWNDYMMQLKEAGVTYLVNDSVVLKKGTEHIRILGAAVDTCYYKKGLHRPTITKDVLDRMLPQEKKKASYQIMLAHNPEYFDAYVRWGADLVLSGHVHGGIMILPFLGGVIAPSFQLFPKYDFGEFHEKKSTMIVSRGLAVHSIKIRVLNVPELSVITLRKG